MSHQAKMPVLFLSLALGVGLLAASVAPAQAKPGFSVIHVPTAPADSKKPATTGLADRPSQGPGTATDDANELLRHRMEAQKVHEKLNQVNPIAGGAMAPQGQGQETPQGTLDPAPQSAPEPLTRPTVDPETYAKLKGFLGSAAAQKYMKLFSDPDFLNGAVSLAQSPGRTKMIFMQIALLVFLMIFRGWRASRYESWLGKLWVRTYCSAIFFVGAIGLIPYWFLGEPYRKMLGAIFRMMKQ